MTRDELNAETEHVNLLEELAKAKDSGKPDKVRAASEKLAAFRQRTRTAREAANPGSSVPTVTAKAKASN